MSVWNIFDRNTLADSNTGIGGLSGSYLTQAQNADIDVLNFALTLEHLEYAFYRDGLANFRNDGAFAFLNRPGIFTYLSAIRDHEKAHVNTLTQTIKSLGGTPVGEAKYNFGYNDAPGFIKVAQALENTGVSAYDGAVSLIQTGALKTAAATIATIEARHAAYLNLINGASPFPSAVDEPKTKEQILQIAGPFIVG